MELELKHIATYLDYGLQAVSPENEIKEVDWKIQTYDSGKVGLNFLFSEYENTLYKPLLRPLSDLTKPITHNGETFVPAQALWSVDIKDEEAFEDFGIIPPYWENILKLDPKHYDWRTIQLLLSWHFDVFGLLEKGLAIPKTLQPC